jgi:iron complex outermembrane recepter protein
MVQLFYMFLSVVLFPAASPEHAPDVAVFSDITGIVTDSRGNPLAGAYVIVAEVNTGTTTGQEGMFHLKNLATGVYHLNIQHLGYAAGVKRVELKAAGTFVRISLQESSITLKEFVVQDQRSGQLGREQSLNVSSFHRNYLSENPGMTLMQSLERIPGIGSMNIGAGISKPVIRGMAFHRVVVAENNIKQQGQQWGADHGLEIDPFSIERLEVIKGPAALIFGSDAIGGVINIRPPAVPQESTLQSETSLVARSNNELLGFSQMIATNRRGRFIRIRASMQDYADYKVPADSFTYNNWVMPIAGRRLVNTGGRDLSGSLNTGIRKDWGITAITLSNYNQTAGFFPGSHGIPDPSSLLNRQDTRSPAYPRQSVNHFKALSNTNLMLGRFRLEADLGYQQNLRREFNPPHVHGAGPLPDSNLELELTLQTFSFGLKLHQYRNMSRDFVYGIAGSFQQNRRGGYNFLLPDFNTAEAGMFALYRESISGRIFLNAGIRVDLAQHNISEYYEEVWADSYTISHYRLRSPDIRASFANATGNLGISWLFAGSWNLKANFGSSFRNPTPVELSANGIHHGAMRHEKGDPSLDPERAWQLDAGLVFDRPGFYFAVSPFMAYFPNFLFLNPTGRFSELPGAGQVYQFAQAKALHFGGEFYGEWQITPALHASAGGDLVWAGNLENHFPLPFTPPPVMTASLRYVLEGIGNAFPHIHLVTSMRTVADQNRVARNEPATDGYSLVNAGIVASIQAGRSTMEISLHVQNVFNTLYQDHLSFYRKLGLPEPGRNFRVGVRIPLIQSIN